MARQWITHKPQRLYYSIRELANIAGEDPRVVRCELAMLDITILTLGVPYYARRVRAEDAEAYFISKGIKQEDV